MLKRTLAPPACAIALAVLALAAPLAAPAAGEIVTNASEDLRTGWYPNQTTLTPSLVSGGTFGQLWSTPVEGQVYAQPLLDGGTLIVPTEADDVYGLNASTGAVRWHTSLGTPWNASDIGCGDLSPTIGVTATPVIDTETGIAYMTHKAYLSGHSGPAAWYMDAINVGTGAEQPGFPVALGGTAQNAPEQRFEATTELQRPGLLLMEGVVYAAFGSDCDHTPWQGWVFGVSTGGAVRARWVADETGNGAGIWQSGAGLTSDGPGTILLSTGNGGAPTGPIPGSSPPADLGESIVRLRVQGDGSLRATDFFAPFDATSLDEWDADFASGGVTGLPNAYFGTPAIPHLAVAVGKDGYVYLLNRDNLGGIGEGPSGSDNVVQRIGPNGGVWSRPGVWPGEGGWVYIPTASPGNSAAGSSGALDVYRYGVSGEGKPKLSLAGESSEAFGFSSSAPVITSSGTTAGSALVWIVWAPNGSGVGAQLRAYSTKLTNGADPEPELLWSAPVGTSAKFATPGVGNGRMYVGTRDGHVLAFGSPSTPPLSGAPVEFPTTREGDSSQAEATLTANEAVTVTKLSSSSSQFKLGEPTPKLPATLAQGQQLHVPVTFAPSAAGPQGATLLASTSEGASASVALSGRGQSPAAKLEVSPPVLSFGGVPVGHAGYEAVTFSNVGGEPVTIEEVKPPAAPFSASELPTPGKTTIQPEKSLTIPISFEPKAASPLYKSEITLRTSTGEASTAALTGSSAAPGVLAVSSEAVSFGAVAVGQRATRSFTVSNVGESTLTIEKSKPPDGGEFAAVGELENPLPEGTSIAAGESLVETVAFAPTASGAASGAWSLTGDDGSGLHEVKFSGEGVEARSTEPGGSHEAGKEAGSGNGAETGGGGSSANGTSGPTPLTSTLPEQSVLPSKVAVAPPAKLASKVVLEHAHGVLVARLACPAAAGGACRGAITLKTLAPVVILQHGVLVRHPALTIATARYALAAGRAASVTLHTTGVVALALLAQLHAVRAHAIVVPDEPAGAHASVVAVVTIRPPAPSRSR